MLYKISNSSIRT